MKKDQELPVLSPTSYMKYQTLREKNQESPVEAESIEHVEGKLQAFQDRLLQYGKDMFGDDFVIMALADTNHDATVEQHSGICRTPGPTADPDLDLGTYKVHQNAAMTGNGLGKAKQVQSKRDKKAKENAKSVLMRFLEDREELVKLRVINKAAQERLHERIGHVESSMKRLHTMMRDYEKRKKTEILNTRAFLSELRKKLTSVERRQSRLHAIMTMPDNEHRDAVLERHSTIEKKETKSKRIDVERRPAPRHMAQDAPHGGLEDTLSQLSKELKEIEKSMKTFGDQNISSL